MQILYGSVCENKFDNLRIFLRKRILYKFELSILGIHSVNSYWLKHSLMNIQQVQNSLV